MLTIDLMFNLQIKSKTGGNLQTLGVHLKGFLFATCYVSTVPEVLKLLRSSSVVVKK